MGGGWVLDFARIKLTQPSLAGAGAELGNNVCLGPSMEDRKSQFRHAAAKRCCGSGNLLIFINISSCHHGTHSVFLSVMFSPNSLSLSFEP